MSRRIRVYSASKLHHFPLWRQLKEEWTEIEFTARWLFEHVGNVPDTPDFAERFWRHDMEDVRRSDVVMVYADDDDHLRGALVEAGMGIAYGLKILCVGNNVGYGTWQYHEQVIRVEYLTHARDKLGFWAGAL